MGVPSGLKYIDYSRRLRRDDRVEPETTTTPGLDINTTKGTLTRRDSPSAITPTEPTAYLPRHLRIQRLFALLLGRGSNRQMGRRKKEPLEEGEIREKPKPCV